MRRTSPRNAGTSTSQFSCIDDAVFSGAHQGCGLRASMKAKMVISKASPDKAASSKIFFRLMGSGVAKQPQLMSICNK